MFGAESLAVKHICQPLFAIGFFMVCMPAGLKRLSTLRAFAMCPNKQCDTFRTGKTSFHLLSINSKFLNIPKSVVVIGNPNWIEKKYNPIWIKRQANYCLGLTEETPTMDTRLLLK